MQTLDECVIQHEHNGRCVPDPAAAEEQHLPNVTNISDLWVTQAEFPQNKGCIEHKSRNNDSQDQPTEDLKVSMTCPITSQNHWDTRAAKLTQERVLGPSNYKGRT